MIKINSLKIERKNFILQIACALIIIVAYFSSRAITYIAGVASMVYLCSNVKWEQKFSLFMFLLSFSPIFKAYSGQTSIFMLLRIAIVFSYLFQNKEKINATLIFLSIAFFSYCVIVSEIYKTDYLVAAINLILWILIGYVLIHTVSPKNSAPVIRGLSNGVLATGIIGLFLENIPQINNEVSVLATLAEDGALVSRYAGFWGDPNFFSVTIIASMWFLYFEFNNSKISIVEFLIRCSITSFIGLMTLSKSCVLLLLVFWIYVIVAKNHIKTAPKVALFFSLLIAGIIFLWKNPYWLGDVLYRFTGTEDEMTLNSMTTGRYDLWVAYMDEITDNFTWIFGNGLNKANLNDKAMHNILIQAIYYIGIVGTSLFFALMTILYNSAKPVGIAKNKNNPAKFAFISILATLFFLDGFLIEQYYYMTSLSFLYLLGREDAETEEKTAILSEETVV